jgi:general secretion pathway protein A
VNDPHMRPLADDPNFLASLSDLDDGLGGPGQAFSSERPAQVSARQVPQPPARPLARGASLGHGLPALVSEPGRRPLLDLFPTTPETRLAAPAPPMPPMRQPIDSRHGVPVSSGEAPATYETFYGLRERPFSLSTNPKFLYQSAEYDRVAQRMLGAIGQRDPLVVVTGEIGMGKTTLCRALLEQLDRRTLTSVVTDPFASMAELQATLLVDFGVVSRDEAARGGLARASDAELSAALHDFLVSLAQLQAFAVVVIDEAQHLPAPVVDAIRMLVNALASERLMQVVLVGQPQLSATLVASTSSPPHPTSASSPSSLSLDAGNGRQAVTCTLGGLARDEMSGYVMHRLRVAGDRPRVDFDEGAIERLNVLSGGTPRIVNLLCDRALANGFAKAASTIDAELVDGAAADLDLAPPAPARSALALAGRFAAFVLLVLLGAAVGAFAFRGDLSKIVTQWKHAPTALQGAPGQTR